MTTEGNYHAESEKLAAEAESLLRRHDVVAARTLYGQAAAWEARAVDVTPADRPRTKGIFAVSAAALFYKGGQLPEAERFALNALAAQQLPQFALDDLRQLLQVIWEAKELQLAHRRMGDEELQIAIRGSDIGAGRAPLGLVLDKVVGVRSLLYRVTELLAGYPLRTRGIPSEEIREICQPWLSEPQAGSYKFAIRLVEPLQPELIPTRPVMPAQIGEGLLKIISAVSPTTHADVTTNGISDAIPAEEYRQPILKLVRNIVPDGRRVREIEFVGLGGSLSGEALLHPGARNRIETSLSAYVPSDGVQDLRGILRAVDLDRTWLDIATGTSRTRCRIGNQVLDDVIGPMLNRRVVAKARGSGGTFTLLDIELDHDASAGDDLSF